jgi:hypothetical protein
MDVPTSNAALAARVIALHERLRAEGSDGQPKRPEMPVREATPAVINEIAGKYGALASASAPGLSIRLAVAGPGQAESAAAPAAADAKDSLRAASAAGQIADAQRRGGGVAIIVTWHPPSGGTMETTFTADEFEQYMRVEGPQGHGSVVTEEGEVHSMWDAIRQAMRGIAAPGTGDDAEAEGEERIQRMVDVGPAPGILMARLVATMLTELSQTAEPKPAPYGLQMVEAEAEREPVEEARSRRPSDREPAAQGPTTRGATRTEEEPAPRGALTRGAAAIWSEGLLDRSA